MDEIRAIQELLQSTTAEDSEDSDDDDEGRDASANDDQQIAMVVCDGDGGCGGTFPCDQHGSEFEFAKLCSNCYNDSAPRSDENEDDINNFMTDGVDGGMDDEENDKSNEGSSGNKMGLILGNVRDTKMDRYDVMVGTNELAFNSHVNDHDNVNKKIRKFWKVHPDTTPLLYGYKHYHAMLNTNSRRGWIGHCRLTSEREAEVGNCYVLWEIWETRCNRPRYDGIIIDKEGECSLVKRLETWLIQNDLSSDLTEDFDEEWYERYCTNRIIQLLTYITYITSFVAFTTNFIKLTRYGRKFNDYIAVNRWAYDPQRGISINTKNPQRAKNKSVLPKEQLEFDGPALGARMNDGELIRSSRLFTKRNAVPSIVDVDDVINLSDESEEGNEGGDSDGQSSVGEESVPPSSPPSKKQNKKKNKKNTKPSTTNTVLVKWTEELHTLLRISVGKHKGKASNGGIDWTKVASDINVSKKYAMGEWRKHGKRLESICDEGGENNNNPNGSAEVNNMNGCDARLDRMEDIILQQRNSAVKDNASLKQYEIQVNLLKESNMLLEQQNAKQASLLERLESHILNIPAAGDNANPSVNSGLLCDDDRSEENCEPRKKKNKQRGRKRGRTSENSVVMTESELRRYNVAVSSADEICALKKALLLRETMGN